MKVKLLALVANFAAIVSLSAQQPDTLKSIDLQEVYVSAFRIKSIMKELPQNIQVLNRRDIREIPNESVSDLLKKTATVDIVEYPGFSANIGIRGYAPVVHGSTYTLTLVNGIHAGTNNLSTIDLSNIGQVEILKGPYSAFFGSGAMAGVLNLVTPHSTGKVRSSSTLSVGSFGTYGFAGAAGGDITSRLNFDISIKALTQGKDYKTGKNNILKTTSRESEILDNTSGSAFKNTTYNKYTGGLRLGYKFSPVWQLNVYENVFVADKILSNGTIWGIYGSDEKDIRRWSQNIALEGNTGRHQIKFIPYLNNEDVDYYNNISDTSFLTSRYNFKSYGVVLQDAISLGNHKLIIGLDNHSQKYINKQWTSAEMRTSPYQPDYANIANGAFMQMHFRSPNDRMNASVGLRYDLIYFKVFKTSFITSSNSTEAFQTVNPNLSIRYTILPGLSFQTGAGTAFMAPDAFKKTGVYTSGTRVYKGNPDLDPETSLSYDAGFLYFNTKIGIKAGINWFDTFHNGLMIYDSYSQDTTSFKNADDARMNGLEFTFAYDFGSLLNYRYNLRLYGNLTVLSKSEVTVNDKTSDMKYVRKNNGAFGLEFRNKNLSLRTHARYIGHRLEDNWIYGYESKTYTKIPIVAEDGHSIRPGLVNEAILEHPDFLVFDFSGSYTIARRFVLGVSVQNLFDENYTEKDAYNMPGRSFTGSLTINF